MAGIYLLGTLHWDPDGEARVYHALETLAPDIATVEYTPTFSEVDKNNAGELFAERVMKRLRDCQKFEFSKEVISETGELARVVSKNEGFEYSAVKRFADNSGIPFRVLGNHDDWKNAADNYGPEHIEDMILKIGSMDRLREYIADKYAKTRTAYDSGINPEDEGKSVNCSLTGNRDSAISSGISELWQPGTTLVHTGGAWHYFDSPGDHTIYSQLADLSPKRVLINEFETTEVPTA